MARAKELAILGERLSAEKAFEWGLVNRLYQDNELHKETLKLAQQLSRGPMSLGLIRKAFWNSLEIRQFNLEKIH